VRFQSLLGNNFLQVVSFLVQTLYFIAIGFTPVSRARRFFSGFHKFLRLEIIKALRNAFLTTQLRNDVFTSMASKNYAYILFS
jgi:hypothetical protein